MSKVYSTVWVVSPEESYSGLGSPEVGFTTEDEARTWARDNAGHRTVTEVEIFIKSEDPT